MIQNGVFLFSLRKDQNRFFLKKTKKTFFFKPGFFSTLVKIQLMNLCFVVSHNNLLNTHQHIFQINCLI